jgi:hypothetical protein
MVFLLPNLTQPLALLGLPTHAYPLFHQSHPMHPVQHSLAPHVGIYGLAFCLILCLVRSFVICGEDHPEPNIDLMYLAVTFVVYLLLQKARGR